MQAALAPVPVLMPNPASPEAKIMTPQAQPLVAATAAFIQWTVEPLQPVMNGVVHVSIPHFTAIGAFFIRCKTGAALPDQAAAANVNPFTCRLTAVAWSRILTSLHGGGAFAVTLGTLPKFHDRIRSLPPDAALDIIAADWFPAPDLITPNNAAVRAHHDRIRFLTHMTLTKMGFEDPPFSVSMPYSAFALLVLALGPISTQASRNDLTSDLYVTCELLVRDYSSNSDAAKAYLLMDLIKGLDIPFSMRSHRAIAANARLDIIEGMKYQSDNDKNHVETRRIFNIREWYGARAPC